MTTWITATILLVTGAGPTIDVVGPSPDSNIEGALFTDENHGWVYSTRFLYRTATGGRSWRRVELPRAAETVSGLDQIGGETFVLAGGRLFSRTDSEELWSAFSTPLDYPAGELTTFSISAIGIWVGGGQFRPVPKGHDTATNALDIRGEAWFELQASAYFFDFRSKSWHGAASGLNGYRVSRLISSPAGDLYALSGEKILRLDRSQLKWRSATYHSSCIESTILAAGVTVADLAFGPSALAWASSRNGYVLKSVDSGLSWCQLDKAVVKSPSGGRPVWFLKLHLKDSSQAVAVGVPPGSLHQTYDGGKTWRAVPIENVVRTMYFIAPNLGLIFTDKEVLRLKF